MQKRLVLMVSLGVLASAVPAGAQFYTQHNLVSDGAAVPADRFDPNLVNAWGLVASSTSPWWSANNGTATATLYDGAGVPRPLVVGIPGAPTGIVFNGTTGFVVRSGTAAAPARFIFATEDGAIAGWAPAVRPTQAIVAADRSSSGAVYKGLAIGSTPSGASFLYAADFHNGVVDIFDSAFTRVGSFTDHRLPQGYAPFGIQNVGGTLYVTFAKQDAARHDDVAGAGHGFVDAFDLGGQLVRRVASRGRLNSPWGVALAPATFGAFAGDLLIGNFGDGKINAFDPLSMRTNGELRRKGQLRSAACPKLSIDGLWALQFGNGAGSGSKDTLYFTAGPDAEKHGLLGTIVPAQAPAHCDGDDDDEGENED
jgi:uncharacterized protein (TIGR03118 family)